MAVTLSRQTNGNILEITTATDPSVSGGTPAPVGSTCHTQDGKEFIKFGVLDTDWRDISDETFDVISLTEQLTPPAPTVGLRLYSKDSAKRQMPSVVSKSGAEYPLQASLAFNQIGFIRPYGNSTTYSTTGLVVGVSGTATARNVATTNFYTAIKRLGYVSGGGTGSTCGFRSSVAQFFRGNANNNGGFYAVFRFGISDAVAVANARMFVGMTANTAAHANANPSGLLNVLGVAYDSTNTTFKIMHNDSAGVCTEFDLGADFPSNTLSTDAFELVIFSAKGSASVEFQVTNLTKSITTYYSATTNIPAFNQLLAWQFWRNNGTTGTAVGFDVINFYIETDN